MDIGLVARSIFLQVSVYKLHRMRKVLDSDSSILRIDSLNLSKKHIRILHTVPVKIYAEKIPKIITTIFSMIEKEIYNQIILIIH